MRNGIPADQAAAMSVVIVDDEPAARRTLRECCLREPDLRITGEYADSRSALEAVRARPPDLLFLDVQIDSLTGIALARALDPLTLPQIVFVTAYDQYALEAFSVNAIDYLLKPFDDERFQATLARVRRRRAAETRAERQVSLAALLDQLERHARTANEPQPRVIAEAGGRMHVLDVALIELVEADRNYVRLRVGRDTYTARSTLQEAEASLKSQPMVRFSRFALVNMSHVRELSRTPRGDVIAVLTGGATVTSSEGCRDSVRQYLERFRLRPREDKHEDK
jgi:two-component system LytT family response regulator